MKQIPKNIIAAIAGAVFFVAITPITARAAELGGAVRFADAYSVWGTIIVGCLASLVTFRYAIQFHGSTIGKIFKLFGVGMLLVVCGLFSSTIVWGSVRSPNIIHDVLFALGYIFMLIGATYIKKLSS